MLLMLRSPRLDRWTKPLPRLLPPALGGLLCFLWIAIEPLNKLGGQYAFLVYTSFLLFFFPHGRIGIQLEDTALGIIAAAFGLAWSCLTLAITAYCGRHHGPGSSQSRAILGVGLAVLAFLSGLVRSLVPRLTAASRIALFFPIFLLTSLSSVNATSVSSHDFTDQFLIAVFAAAFALVSTIIFSSGRKSSYLELRDLMHQSIDISCQLLPLSLSSLTGNDSKPPINGNDEKPSPSPSIHQSQDELARHLRHATTTLKPVLAHLRYGIIRSRVSPDALGPIIDSLQRLQRNPLLGLTSHVPGERIQSALRKVYEQDISRPSSVPGTPRTSRTARHSDNNTPRRSEDRRPTIHGAISSTNLRRALQPLAEVHAHNHHGHHHRRSISVAAVGAQVQIKVDHSCRQLSEAIIAALSNMQDQLDDVCGWKKSSVTHQSNGAGQGTKVLDLRLSELQIALSCLFEGSADPTTGQEEHVHDQGRRSTVRIIAQDTHGMTHPDENPHQQISRLAFYMVALIDMAKEVREMVANTAELATRATPRPKWRLPTTLIRWKEVFPWPNKDGSETDESSTVDDDVEDIDGVEDPTTRPDVEDVEALDFANASLAESRSMTTPRRMKGRFLASWRMFWDYRQVIRGRIVLSSILHSARHSRHVLFAIKMSLGVSLLSLPAFLPDSTRGRSWFTHSRGAWMVISYMYVLDLHTGAIFFVGFSRLVGTFLGALIGYICTQIAHTNPYGLVVLGTVCSLGISYGIVASIWPPMFTVMGITLPPLLFLRYLGLDNGQSDINLAWLRFVEIAIGIVAAVLVGTLIWPNHARVRYFMAVSGTFDRIIEYYLLMSRDNLRTSLVYQGAGKEYDSLEIGIRRHINTCRTLVLIQRREASLLPRPIKLYSEVVDRTEHLLEAFYEVRLLRFSVPRKAIVLDVLPIRRGRVSAILVNLWACSQSFRSRTALPQFLPSPRTALAELSAAADEHAKRIRQVRKDDFLSREDSATRSERNQAELAALYAMAENEALAEVCNILEELVAAARTLFGSKTFYTDASAFERHDTMAPHAP
ncbi:hypothetical protein TREMEDRAFT_73636 [Tremella mesenterica DSM 1558]|uniref:uncharacterized protein n=1 Tax=Tremella mesenterica (strain ATCC 24925 / CBS 8224 / DSM 1558 / NBRC 9311 / NRRL Y-6157 / RJB 2259-6 / UBC 559-6) TaxID=578456 RepID=UPI0003F48C55|nr:uncharacterized protein TREMEDRAFT_73636 [Tremella mesenterica DSM 1558]EIW69858.1 hypothetical protein TREMEDRAFT_73636 [Tremella mesenterica DSM 1558]